MSSSENSRGKPTPSQDSSPKELPPPPGKPFWLFVLGLPVALGIIFTLLMVMQYRQVKALVAQEPTPLPQLGLSSEKGQRVVDKISEYLDKGTDTLTLDSLDMNALLLLAPKLWEKQSQNHISLGDTTALLWNVTPAKSLTGPVAWLVHWFRPEGWLNSSMEMNFRMEKAKIRTTLVRAQMNGIEGPVKSFNSDPRLDIRSLVSDTLLFDKAVSQLNGIRVEAGLIKMWKTPQGIPQ